MLFFEINPWVISTRILKITSVVGMDGEYIAPCHTLVYFLGGSCNILLKSAEAQAKKESLIILKRESKCRFFNISRDCEAVVISFSYTDGNEDINNDDIFEDEQIFNSDIFIGAISSISNLISDMLKISQKNGEHFQLGLKGRMISVLSCIARGYSEYVFTEKKNTLSDGIMTYIDKNYFFPLNNFEIGERFSFHPAYINSIVKDNTGFGLHEYINIRRISKSIELLEKSDMKINEISYTVGFLTSSSYYRCFKKIIGVSPEKYRGTKALYPRGCGIETYGLSLDEAVDFAMSEAEGILFRNMIKFYDCYPHQCAKEGIYDTDKDFFSDWHSGIWAGMYWFLYEETKKPVYKKYAEKIGDILYDIIENGGMWHLDMAMIFVPVCMYDLKYNNNTRAKRIIIMASNCLMEKYTNGGEFIQSTYYDSKSHRKKVQDYNSRISLLSNYIILEKAYRITGNRKYINVARKSAESIYKYNIAETGSCIFDQHIAFDGGQKKFIQGNENQGDDMSLAMSAIRSNAWAIWGIALHYGYEKSKNILDKFCLVFEFVKKELTDCFFYKPDCWTNGKGYDSSASAISICALREMMRHIPCDDPLYIECEEFSLRLFWDVFKFSANTFDNGSECLLENGFKSYRDTSRSNITSGNIVGDYFWLEALMRLKGNKIFWDSEVN